MAGEKLRTQQANADKSTTDNTKSSGSSKPVPAETEPAKVFNANLPDLYKELLPFYIHNKMDGYLLYIFAIITRDLFRSQGRSVRDVLGLNQDTLDPRVLFQQSLVANPWNWSCWLEFEAYCIEQQCKVPTWDEMMSTATTYRFRYQGATGEGPIVTVDPVDKQCGRAIYAFFLSHYHLEQHRGELAQPALEKLQKIFPTSLFLLAHIAVAHYTQRIYDVAEECFVVLRAKDPYRLQHIDTYSNILYVQEKLAELSLLAHHVVHIDKFAPEVCCVIGNHYSLRGQHEKAVTYFQRALRGHPAYLSAWTLLGHEYMELRNSVAAIQCYRHGAALIANKQIVVDRPPVEPSSTTTTAAATAAALQPSSPGDFRAWYGLGQTYEMLHCHQYALHYYQKAAGLRPDDARMWSAVGNAFLRLHLKGPAIAALERAVYQCQDQEGVATRDLARLYKEEASAVGATSSRSLLLPGDHVGGGGGAFAGAVTSPKTIYITKAAETYYLFLVIANQNNGNNLWPVHADVTVAMDHDDATATATATAAATTKPTAAATAVTAFPPATLDIFFAALKDPQHPLHAWLVTGDDFLTAGGVPPSSSSGAAAAGGALPRAVMMPSYNAVTGLQVDAEQAEALLFLAQYCQAMQDATAAQYFCSRLLTCTGTEGDQARIGSLGSDDDLAVGCVELPSTGARRRSAAVPPGSSARRQSALFLPSPSSPPSSSQGR
eukprot:gene9277-6642_t